MPSNSEDWKPLNVLVDESKDKPQATIWMNKAQSNLRAGVNLFQTCECEKRIYYIYMHIYVYILHTCIYILHTYI